MKTELLHTLDALKSHKVILYPTDTVWGIGCDATDAMAVAKIFAIKQRKESKSLIILVDSSEMLNKYIDEISDKVTNLLKKTRKPTTIIYPIPKGLAKNVVAQDNTVAIRIVKKGFCHKLIRLFGKPIVSTSANISGHATPQSFKEIDTSILDAVDYVVNLQQNKITYAPSKIIKIKSDGMLEVIRE